MSNFDDSTTEPLPFPTVQRIDIVCDAFESEWLAGKRPDLAAHLAAAADLERAGLLRELVGLDIEYRRRLGEQPQLAEYVAAFPQFSMVIEQAFGRSISQSGGKTTAANAPPGADCLTREIYDSPATHENAGPSNLQGLPRLPKIAGYKISGKLGSGGMGVVWRAVQLSTGREVALKTIEQSYQSESARARFQREVELAARLSHPHIAQVFDSGKDGEIDYYAMQLIEGKNLDQYVRSQQLDQTQILELIRAVCSAVQHAHQRGVIHRDLKPANILVDRQGNPHVLDFGLAKAQLEQEDTERLRYSLTREGTVAGTLAYMSPEQAAGRIRDIDTRTDVYALGVILFQLLTGQVPHDMEGTSFNVLRRIVDEEIRSPRQFLPQLDRELEAILLKALAREPAERYSSALEMGADIQRFLQNEPVVAHAPSALYLLRKRAWKYRLPLGLATVVIGVCVAATVFYIQSIEAERDRTQQQFLRAERKSIEASRSAAAAEENAAAAKQSAAEAQQQRNEAIAKEQEAQRQSQLADEARRRAEEQRYSSQLMLAYQNWRDREYGFARETLAETQSNLRGWEFSYLDEVINRQQTRVNVGQTPSCAAFSPDGEILATAKGNVTLWDPQTGASLRSIDVGDRPAFSLVFHPDGKSLITAGKGHGIVSWDVATGKRLREMGAECGDFPRLAIDQQGARIAEGGAGDTVRVWSVATGLLEQTLTIPAKITGTWIESVDFSPDGKLLAAASANGVRVWELETADVKLEVRPDGVVGRATAVAFRADGQRLLIGGTKLIVWDLERNEVAVQIEQGNIASASLSPDGKVIASVNGFNQVDLWNADTGNRLGVLGGHGGSITLVRIHPDSETVFAAGEAYGKRGHNVPGEAYLWSIPKVLHSTIVARTQGPIAKSVDGHLIATTSKEYFASGWDARVSIHRLGVPDPDVRFSPGDAQIRGLAFHPRGEQLLVVPWQKGPLAAWDVKSGKSVLTFDGANRTRCTAYSADGRFVVTGEDTRPATFKIWKADTGALVKSFPIPSMTSDPCTLMFSPDGTRLFGFSFYVAGIWDVESGVQIHKLSKPQGAWIESAAMSSDGKWLAAATQSCICVWNAESGELVKVLPGRLGYTSVSFLPGTDRIVAGSREQRLEIWNATSGQKLLSLKDQPGYATHIFPDAQGHWFLSASADQTVSVWHAGERPLQTHTAALASAAGSAAQDSPQEITNTIGLKMKLLPAGRFLMGGTRDVHLTRSFYLSTCEVTGGEYAKIMGKNPASHLVPGEEEGRHPVTNVRWYDAIDFCNGLSKLEKQEPYYERIDRQVRILGGNGYRLPTDAEWEYACRAGKTTRYYFGDDEREFGEYEWFKGNCRHKQPVGLKKPNPWGLHDMLGNVWEWCWDSPSQFAAYESGHLVDPMGSGSEHAKSHILRGGCWMFDPRDPGHRGGNLPEGNSAIQFIGFRVAKTM